MTQRRKNEPTTTAADAYRELGVEIETQLDGLAQALEHHHVAQRANPADWGYVGDLNHVRDLLSNVLACLPKAGA